MFSYGQIRPPKSLLYAHHIVSWIYARGSDIFQHLCNPLHLSLREKTAVTKSIIAKQNNALEALNAFIHSDEVDIENDIGTHFVSPSMSFALPNGSDLKEINDNNLRKRRLDAIGQDFDESVTKLASINGVTIFTHHFPFIEFYQSIEDAQAYEINSTIMVVTDQPAFVRIDDQIYIKMPYNIWKEVVDIIINDCVLHLELILRVVYSAQDSFLPVGELKTLDANLKEIEKGIRDALFKLKLGLRNLGLSYHMTMAASIESNKYIAEIKSEIGNMLTQELVPFEKALQSLIKVHSIVTSALSPVSNIRWNCTALALGGPIESNWPIFYSNVREELAANGAVLHPHRFHRSYTSSYCATFFRTVFVWHCEAAGVALLNN